MRPAVLALVVVSICACSASDPGTDNRNPPRLYLALLGNEVGGQVQLLPVEPNPF